MKIQTQGHNKDYMSIGISVWTTKFAARNPDNYLEHWGLIQSARDNPKLHIMLNVMHKLWIAKRANEVGN